MEKLIMTEALKAVILNAETGEIVERVLTADEIAERETSQDEFTQIQEAKIAARQSALAKLKALGLTEAEIAAL
jgi:DNA-binding NarL/FixJ family response regulator